MKRKCNIILDLLPLYVDDVVSDDTREFVEDHLAQCEDCRREARLLGSSIVLPPEKDVKPLDTIRKQWDKHNILVWGLSAALAALCLIMALPVFDTSMQYHIQEFIGGSLTDILILILPLAAVGFGVEWWFTHLKKLRWLALIPLVFPAAVLVVAEISWAAGGWDRFGSSIYWFIGFPLLLGAALAVALKVTLEQKLWVKKLALVLLVVFLAAAALLWPKSLDSFLDIEADSQMLEVYENGTWEWEKYENTDFSRYLGYIEVSPCLMPPGIPDEDYILVRLNEEYVLCAPYNDTPYVYRYSGDLTEFSGEDVCYRVYHYPALYINLKTDSNI